MRTSQISAVLTVVLVASALMASPALAQAPNVVAIWGTQSPSVFFGHPNGVAIGPSGHVFVADQIYQRVLELTTNGTFVAQYGAPGADTLLGPAKVALANDGTLYVVDGYACGVSWWRSSGYQGWFGGCGSGPGQLSAYSWGVAVQGDRVYVSNTLAHRIEVFDTGGQFVFGWPIADLTEGLAVDANGRIYVAQYAGRVGVYDPAGNLVSTIGEPGSGPGQLNSPYDVALDAAGNVYVADAYNHRIEVFAPGGAYLTSWGTRGSEPGQFIQPRGVCVGADGKVYVADTWNDRIQVFSPITAPTATTHRSWGSLKATYR